MSQFLPLFPLKLVVFPGEKLNLHIFEPRYRQLINDCADKQITFGIVPYFNGKIAQTGTEVELTKIAHRYEDGKMDIRTKGISTFKIIEFFREIDGKLYAGAQVTPILYTKKIDQILNSKILEKLKELHSILDINQKTQDLSKPFVSFDIAHFVGFNLEQKLNLLTIEEEVERQQIIFDHLKRLIPIASEMNQLRKRVKMNGHFKNEIPPLF